MISKKELLHTYYLDKLTHNLGSVNENRRDIVSIIREPIWTPTSSLNEASLCDLIIIYPNHAVPIELKSSINRMRKAEEQIRYGFDYCDQVLNMPCSYGKFVWYVSENSYKWRNITK